MIMPFDQITIKTPRLLLRPLCVADAQAHFAIRSEKRVMKYVNRAAWTTMDEAHERILQHIAAMQKNEYLNLGIVANDDGGLIGTCVLFRFDWQSKRAEIGYELRPDKWGRGYINEALISLINFGFNELLLNRIEADIDPRNEKSVKTVERLGFIREGLLRERWILNDEKSDSVIYGLLASEFTASPNKAVKNL